MSEIAAPPETPAVEDQPGSWTFTERPDDPLTLQGAVFEALGGASACWTNLRGAGVFESTRAAEIGNALVARLRDGLPDPDRPTTGQVLIVDVDGTVADMGKGEEGRRRPFDWDRVREDTPIQPVIDLVRVLRPQVDRVVWLSGRDEVCYSDTFLWLLEHAGADHAADLLLMRSHKDNRPDDVVKRELYGQLLAAGLRARWVVDDRDKVVKMWRGLGLTVLQVAEGAF